MSTLFFEGELLGKTCKWGREAGYGRGKTQKRMPCQGRFNCDLIQCRGGKPFSLYHTLDCPCIGQGALSSVLIPINHWTPWRMGGVQPSRGQFCGKSPDFCPSGWEMQYQLLKGIQTSTRGSNYPKSCSRRWKLTLIERLLWAGVWTPCIHVHVLI